MKNIVVLICALGFVIAAYLFMDSNKRLNDSETHIDVLYDSLAVLEEDIIYLRKREADLVESGGKLREEYNAFKFSVEQSKPTIIVKPTKPNPNEKVVPISVTASEHYIELLTARYQQK
jgi:hypothetical protein